MMLLKILSSKYFKTFEDLFSSSNPPVGSQVYLLSLDKTKVGGYREEIKSGVDHDLWIRIARKC